MQNDQDESCGSESETDKRNNKNCSKASKYQLLQAGITSGHKFKTELGYTPNSRFDICACSDGSITIAPQGQCGKIGKGFEPGYTGQRWK